MMNIEEEDVRMGSTKFCIRTKSLRTSGAGVNALNLAFATSDPLSELVWSPHKGLSLKCATSAAADKKPFLLWNVGRDVPPLQSARLNRSGDGGADADHLIIRDCDDSNWKMEEDDKKDAILEGNPRNVKMDDISNPTAAAVLETPLKKLESSAENELRGLAGKDDCFLGGGGLPRENALPAEGSPTGSRICLYEEKGKGKALSDGDIYGSSSDDDDDDDSHESVESCTGAGRCWRGMKGVKRQIYEKGVVLGSKRTKMQIHGSDGSTSVTRPDSSFMKWMSNVTKGLSLCQKAYSPSPLPLACLNGVCGKNCPQKLICFRHQDSASLSTGFQTIFQSLYCKEADAMNNGGKKITESTDHVVDDEVSPEDLPHRNCGNSSEQCNKEVDPTQSAKRGHALDEEMKITAKDAYPGIPTDMSDVPAKGDPRTSLWIARFSTSTPRPEKGKEIDDLDGQMNVVFPVEQNNSSETGGESAHSNFNACMKESRNMIIKSEASFEEKSISKVCPILPSQRFSTEAMASVFARRLDALRQHITSSKTGKKSLHICFFCGGCHDVHECPNVTKTELEDLLLKGSTLNGGEESLYLCIRCSQSDHWAVSCPLAASSRQRASTDCSSRKPGLEYLPTYQAWKLEISAPAMEPDVASLQNTVGKSQIFDAIRKLRLSRAEILRWMNSNVPASRLNGFFLRLRLGKVETGLGGSTTYYLACIAGDQNDHCNSSKSILVDVGGVKSFVATYHVSNHEFLQDEIEAWWCRTVDRGCSLPSLADLNSKFNHRQTLDKHCADSW